MLLETERLIIRKPNEDDATDIARMSHDEVILKYNCIEPMSEEQVKEKLKRENSHEDTYVIEHKLEHKVIGEIGLSPDYLRYGVNSVTISYHLDTSYTGKGYMTEAVIRVLRYCFEEKKCDCVTARVFTPNERSNNMVKKLGFTLEGTLRKAVKAYKDVIYDDNLYNMTKEEFNQKYK
jgi:ribosomal-protein-alanine N-acetyltransferase